jgi:hypothetical protein
LSLIEVILAGLLLALMAALLADAWASFGRTAIVAVARGRVAQEANLAAEMLARDLGGCLAGQPGGSADFRDLGRQVVGSTLYLSFDDGAGSTIQISYALDPDDATRLVRKDWSTGLERTAARFVAGFDPTDLTLQGTGQGVRLDLTFRHRTYDAGGGTFSSAYSRTFTLVVPDPNP